MINRGISFGWGQGVSVILIGLVLVGLIFSAVKMRELWGKVGLILMIIGGSGNLLQRLLYGGVVDNWQFFGLFYNNAWDYFIVGGVIVYGYTYFVRRQRSGRS